eukprot:4695487-Pleurochrysis_carterae.AAC.2
MRHISAGGRQSCWRWVPWRRRVAVEGLWWSGRGWRPWQRGVTLQPHYVDLFVINLLSVSRHEGCAICHLFRDSNLPCKRVRTYKSGIRGSAQQKTLTLLCKVHPVYFALFIIGKVGNVCYEQFDK